MKRLCVAVVMALSSMAVAQEIGTEITPVTPGSSNNTQPVNQPNDNPYATTQPKEGDKPADPKGAPKKESSDGQVSAGKGAFGLRATFGGQSVGLAGRGVAATPISTGTVGFAYWGSDAFTLLFDLGFGMGISGGGVLVGFGATVGMDYHFRTPAEGLRPLIHVQLGLGSAIAADLALELSAQVGGGAEYFFSPSFSVSGRVGLGLRLPFSTGSMTLTTFTPAAGAAWYF